MAAETESISPFDLYNLGYEMDSAANSAKITSIAGTALEITGWIDITLLNKTQFLPEPYLPTEKENQQSYKVSVQVSNDLKDTVLQDRPGDFVTKYLSSTAPEAASLKKSLQTTEQNATHNRWDLDHHYPGGYLGNTADVILIGGGIALGLLSIYNNHLFRSRRRQYQKLTNS